MSAPLAGILRRDRALIVAAMLAIAGLAWLHLVRLAGEMDEMTAMGMAMPQMSPWNASELVVGALMWTVMMIAMMVPSAAPVVLVFAAMHREGAKRRAPYVATGSFLLGYLVAWMAYAVIATLAQWALHDAALLSPDTLTVTTVAGAVLLLAAGAYQWTPLKRRCLAHCRSPLGFLLSHWREGARGAFLMGARHGSYCVGCCWILMALLFVAGVMNLLWVAALGALVLLEKTAPWGDLVSRVGGVGLIAAGVALLAQL